MHCGGSTKGSSGKSLGITFTNFKKNNSILAKGIECSMLLNETFVKLSDIKNITNTTTIGRVTQINNDNRVNDMGNFEIYFDLITEIELGNFNIGDVIIGLDSNTKTQRWISQSEP